MTKTTIPTTGTATTTASELIGKFVAEGFQPGCPAHLDDWAQKVDRGVCKEAICPGCHAKGLQYQAFHRGHTYRVVGVCSACSAAEEF